MLVGPVDRLEEVVALVLHVVEAEGRLVVRVLLTAAGADAVNIFVLQPGDLVGVVAEAAALAGVGGVAGLGAGGGGHGLFVVVAQGADLAGLLRVAAAAGAGLLALLGAGGGLADGPVAEAVAQGGGLVCLVGVAALAGVGRIAAFGAGGGRHDGGVAVLMDGQGLQGGVGVQDGLGGGVHLGLGGGLVGVDRLAGGDGGLEDLDGFRGVGRGGEELIVCDGLGQGGLVHRGRRRDHVVEHQGLEGELIAGGHAGIGVDDDLGGVDARALKFEHLGEVLAVGGAEAGVGVVGLLDAVPVGAVGGQARGTGVQLLADGAVLADKVLHGAVAAADAHHVLVVRRAVEAEELIVAVGRTVGVEFKFQGGDPVALRLDLDHVDGGLCDVLLGGLHAALTGDQAQAHALDNGGVLLADDLKLVRVGGIGEVDAVGDGAAGAGDAPGLRLAAATAGVGHDAGGGIGGRRGDDAVVKVVAQGGDGLHVHQVAAGALAGAGAVLGAGGVLGPGPFAEVVAQGAGVVLLGQLLEGVAVFVGVGLGGGAGMAEDDGGLGIAEGVVGVADLQALVHDLHGLEVGAVGEGVAGDAGDALGDADLLEAAAVEGGPADGLQAAGQGQLGQADAVAEGVVADGRDGGGHGEAGEAAAELEGLLVDGRDAGGQLAGPGLAAGALQQHGLGLVVEYAAVAGVVGVGGIDLDGGEAPVAADGLVAEARHLGADGEALQAAEVEGVVLDDGDGVGDGDALEAGAALEGPAADGLHALGHREGLQAGAAGEDLLGEVGEACGQGHGGQIVAGAEGGEFDGLHAVGDGDGGQIGVVKGGHADAGDALGDDHGARDGEADKGAASDGGQAGGQGDGLDLLTECLPVRVAGPIVVRHGAAAGDGQRAGGLVKAPAQVRSAGPGGVRRQGELGQDAEHQRQGEQQG